MARLLVDYSTQVRDGETVLVWAPTAETNPLLIEVCREVIRRGAQPVPVVGVPEIKQALLEEASDDILARHGDPWAALIGQTAVTVRIETGVTHMTRSDFDPGKEVQHLVGERVILNALHGTRMVLTLFPTEEMARTAGMDPHDFEDYVFGGVDRDWVAVSSAQQDLIDSVLAGAQTISITAEDTDITLSAQGRTFANCDGTKNMPGGEIYTSPVESATQGHIAFTYPAIFPPPGGSRRVEGVRLWFENGKVVKATAKEGKDYLDAVLAADPGASYVGELAFGTNDRMDRWTGSMLLDEKMGGTMHLALGRAYPWVGGVNISSIHWDMLADLKRGSEVRVDSTLVQKDGRWVL
jgi:aminopeptidase